MMMLGPMRKKVIATGIVAFLVPTVAFGGIFVAYSNKKKAEIEELKVKAETVERYIAVKDMPIGHIVLAEDLELADVKGISAPVNSFAGLDGLVGEKLKVPVYDGTIITESMFYNLDDEVADDIRAKEFNMISLPSDLVVDDYVDIRIAFPTGEDFIVTTGKKIEKVGATHDSNSITMNLDEEDILRLSSAVIESYMNTAVKLYAVKYTNWYEQLYDEKSVDYIQMYKDLIKKLIDESETVEQIEVELPKVPMRDESGEKMRNESGEIMYEPVQYEYKEQKVKKTENDFSDEEIAVYMQLDVEEVTAIRAAIKNNDEKFLALYSQKSVIIETPLLENYPVKSEVAELIKENPNILEDLEAKYNLEELADDREKIEAQYNLGVMEEDRDNKELERLQAISERLSAEIEAQKTERSEYLQSLLRSSSITTTAQ